MWRFLHTGDGGGGGGTEEVLVVEAATFPHNCTCRTVSSGSLKMEADLIPPGGILVPPDPWKPGIVRVHT